MANIDDELINALVRPDQKGRIGKDAPLIQIIGYKKNRI